MTEIPKPTVNKSARIRGSKLRWVVVHSDASPSEQATIGWLQNPEVRASYHLYITRDGRVIRFVPDEESAWSCGGPGKSFWGGINGINSYSLSVSFANRNDGKEFLTPVQKAIAKTIIAAWFAKYPTLEGVITHKMCATPLGRKSDPERAPNFHLQELL